MGKFAIFSDIHFHNWSAFSKIGKDGLNSRLLNTISAAQEICRVAAQECCDAVLFSGDFFHVKKIDADVLDAAARSFKDCALPIYGIAGNHDMASAETNIYSARAMTGLITWLDNQSVTVGNTRIGGVPYIKDSKKLLESIQKLDNPDILLLHTGISGALMGSDYIAKDTDCVDNADMENAAGLVVAGHFHTPQVIYIGDKVVEPADKNIKLDYKSGKTILIPGAPEAHNFGDAGKLHGYWIVDTVQKTLEFRAINSPGFVNLNEIKDLGEIAGNFVKIIRDEKTDHATMAELTELVNSVAAGSRIELERIDVTPITGQSIVNDETTEQLLERYINTRAKGISDSDIKRLFTIGMEFLK